jgi:hypothetical protein
MTKVFYFVAKKKERNSKLFFLNISFNDNEFSLKAYYFIYTMEIGVSYIFVTV